MAEIRVAIVEDEPPARAKLKRLLAAEAGYRVVAEADDVAGGVAALRAGKPDLLFLDIRLGAGSGFDVLTRCAPPYPLVVFTTAHHEHALRAFEFAALDYLLKPFDRERFWQTRRDRRTCSGWRVRASAATTSVLTVFPVFPRRRRGQWHRRQRRHGCNEQCKPRRCLAFPAGRLSAHGATRGSERA